MDRWLCKQEREERRLRIIALAKQLCTVNQIRLRTSADTRYIKKVLQDEAISVVEDTYMADAQQTIACYVKQKGIKESLWY